MMNITELIRKKRLYFDGGTGTVLQKMGLRPGEAPELLNITDPKMIVSLHKSYLDAGCNIIKTNTFGINKNKYSNYVELIEAAICCAKEAVDGRKDSFIAFDIGPSGKLLKPLGDLGFEETVELFASNVKAAVKCGVDLILIETMNDSYETKAAVLAAKENSDLPVFVTNAYDEEGKLMTGADPLAMIALLEGLRVDALGMNCSFGPDKMLEIIDRFWDNSSVPIIVNPNAGLPRIENGKTVYDISPSEFSDYMVKLAESGACILGGCCGTDPEYIRQTIEKTYNIPYVLPEKKDITSISSYTHSVKIGDTPILIGERINPTGKKKLKDAIRAGDVSYILSEAVGQTEKGVHVLDVNVGLPGIDEVAVMKETVEAVQSVTDLPLQIDSSDPKVLEAAIRIYNGKPLVNSVTGKKESMNSVFPLVQKYGGSVIALTMDEAGISQTAKGRVEIAQTIIAEASKYGIDRKDIIVDPLCLTISSDKNAANITLESVRLLHELGIRTCLGVSNISFGLPSRDKINSVFFANALSNGLDCAIMNPYSAAMTDVYYSFKALKGYDVGCTEYIAYASESDTPLQNKTVSALTLEKAIVSGLRAEAVKLTEELILEEAPLDIINDRIVPALNEIGKAFEEKRAYLPQLLMSADSASASFDIIKTKITANAQSNNKTVILATVKGDIHDIGKNIVKVLLESYGYTVYDLGRDVTPEKILASVKNTGCKLVGLSALMTTTVPSMEETIALLKKEVPDVTVMVGGAVLTKDYADAICADHYASDAMGGVRFTESYYSKQ